MADSVVPMSTLVMQRWTPGRYRVLVGFVVLTIAVTGLLLGSVRVASAHVDLVSTTPANVSTVPAPVDVITLTFSGDTDPVEDEFRVEDAAGEEVAIESVRTTDPTTIEVRTATPIESGRTRVTWALRGADGHTMTGRISFTVEPVPGTASTDSDAATIPVTGSFDDAALVDDSPLSAEGSPQRTTMDLADRIASFARWFVYGAALFCIGGLGYLAVVHRGSRAEGRRLTFYIRRAALVVVLASIAEWFAQLVVFDVGDVLALVSPSVWWDLALSGFGKGTFLRLAGATLVLAFLKIDLVASDEGEPSRSVDLSWIDAPTGASPSSVVVAEPAQGELTRLRTEASPLAFVGAVLLIVSESFIGHTSSVEPRIVVLVSDAVHMLAGGLWAAGAFLLASTLWRRHRRGEPTDARLLATRFSVVASASLVAVSLTGIVLAWSILDGFAGLWSTGFGRILLLKVVLVAIVAGVGAYNHRVMVPLLAGDDRSVDARFRVIMTAEAALFGLVLLATSFLVVANPTS